MKNYTDLEQSKKLAEILPQESADMVYVTTGYSMRALSKEDEDANSYQQVSTCWSLAALLEVLSKTINHETLFIETSPALWHVGYRYVYIARADNLVDACVEIINKLHEQNLL